MRIGLSQRSVFESRRFQLARGPTNTECEPPTVCSVFFARFPFLHAVCVFATSAYVYILVCVFVLIKVFNTNVKVNFHEEAALYAYTGTRSGALNIIT